MTSSGAADAEHKFHDAVAGRRVALVHDWLTGMRGGEKVLEAIADLFPGAPIYSLIAYPVALSERLRRHPIHSSFVQNLPLTRRKYRYYLPLFPAAIESFDLTSYDLLVSTSHCVAKGAVPGPHAMHLCYCHSPMRYVWDQEKAYFPSSRGPVGLLRSLSLSKLRLWDVASIPRVDGFWANSRFVAQRIQRYYGRDAEVLPPPVDVAAFRDEDHHDPGTYALAVSALVPYKRLDLAIRACEARGLELRVVGTGPEEKALRALCGRHARLLGRVDGAELRRLYRGARLFLQPGVEDFGIATVEALAAGTPVVALGRGGVLDIVEDGVHGVLYDPPAEGSARVSDTKSLEALSEAIDKCLAIRFNYLELGARADTFSSDRFRERLRSSIVQQLALP
ncbi:MAG: glycosyltransferase [Thermoanaerobaculia bacterium]|nr:glycosyltransferase [Thermoanaerobaculia bacterium]